MRQIAINAGVDGGVVLYNVINARKVNYGYDAYNDKYVDMVEKGIIDPTKVTRSALQNAASIAGVMLTTEGAVAEIPAPAPVAQPQMGGDMY